MRRPTQRQLWGVAEVVRFPNGCFLRESLVILTLVILGTASLPAEEHLASSTPGPAATPSPEPTAQPDPLGLFAAVVSGDVAQAEALLKQGADINATLPHPPPEDFYKGFIGTSLEFYVRSEPGLTPLMLAAARGDTDMVKLLLDWKADRAKETKRNKTFALWLAAKHGHIEVMKLLMNITPDSEAARTRITVDLGAQTATLFRDDKPEKPVPISSGRKKFPTPAGRYLITNKYKMWTSNIYEVRMPFFMRLSCGEVGLHAGRLPGYPASHGCIRLREKDAKHFFATAPIGTLVEVR